MRYNRLNGRNTKFRGFFDYVFQRRPFDKRYSQDGPPTVILKSELLQNFQLYAFFTDFMDAAQPFTIPPVKYRNLIIYMQAHDC